MKPVEGAEAQAVLDAVAAGAAIPTGKAFDGITVYALDAEDEQRIEDGGPVMPPDYREPPTVESPPPAVTTTAPPEDDV
jgi:hypothetical protein